MQPTRIGSVAREPVTVPGIPWGPAGAGHSSPRAGPRPGSTHTISYTRAQQCRKALGVEPQPAEHPVCQLHNETRGLDDTNISF